MRLQAIYYYAALLAGCIFICSCENDPEAIKRLTDKKTAVEEARTVESYLSQAGKVKAKLTSPFMLGTSLTRPMLNFRTAFTWTFIMTL